MNSIVPITFSAAWAKQPIYLTLLSPEELDLGERFIDRLIADTLSDWFAGLFSVGAVAIPLERYRPCKENGDMPGQGAVDLLMEVYPVELKLAGTRTDGNATLYIYEDINEFMRSNSLLGRLGDWFAGFFAIDPTITID